MTATTATASRPSSLFSHRYSDTIVSTPRSRESSHTQHLSSSSSASYSRAPTAHSMPSSTPSPPAYNADELISISSTRRASHGDASLDPSSSAGVKYACASCIRGHRTSSCTHKDGSKGPLYPIRSKGRPPTQCEICRKKRKESGRHVRCDCTGKKTVSTSTPAIAVATSHPTKKAVVAKANIPILPKATGPSSTFERIEASHDSRPSKRSRLHGASISPRNNSIPLARTTSDQHPSGKTLPHLPTFDNVLAPIRTQRDHKAWSLPSIYPSNDAAHIQPLSRSDQESTPRRHSTLSLSSLMNPCGCRSTGSCTCCSDPRQRRAPLSPKQLSVPSQDCDPAHCSCSGTSCRDQKSSTHEAANATTSTNLGSLDVATSSSCTGQGPSSSAAPSIELLLKAVDMSTEFVPPPCGCGQNCRCARCLAKQNKTASDTATAQQRPASNFGSSTMTSSSASPRTPPASLAVPRASTPVSPGTACDDCAACDLALERPSGIGAVDSWMEKQRELQRPPDSRHRSSSTESRAYSAGTSRRNSQDELPATQRGASPTNASVPTLHGGLLTSIPASSKRGDEEVRAELVLVHPKCAACLDVVRNKGVGVLSSSTVSVK